MKKKILHSYDGMSRPRGYCFMLLYPRKSFATVILSFVGRSSSVQTIVDDICFGN